jgi:hypothetical protein
MLSSSCLALRRSLSCPFLVSPTKNKNPQSRLRFLGSNSMQSIQLADSDVENLRARLRKKSDEELRNFGKAARQMVSPGANMGKPPLPTFVLQLEEACAEWRRRHLPPRT